MLIPSKLKYLRLLHNLTQTDVGKEIGATKNYISEVENGKSSLTQAQHDKIVNAIYTVSERKKKQADNVTEILDEVRDTVKKKSK